MSAFFNTIFKNIKLAENQNFYNSADDFYRKGYFQGKTNICNLENLTEITILS
jgi:hypothetical protein